MIKGVANPDLVGLDVTLAVELVHQWLEHRSVNGTLQSAVSDWSLDSIRNHI